MSYKNWTPDDFMLNPKFIEDDNFEPNKTIKTNQYSCTHGANCVQCKEVSISLLAETIIQSSNILYLVLRACRTWYPNCWIEME